MRVETSRITRRRLLQISRVTEVEELTRLLPETEQNVPNPERRPYFVSYRAVRNAAELAPKQYLPNRKRFLLLEPWQCRRADKVAGKRAVRVVDLRTADGFGITIAEIGRDVAFAVVAVGTEDDRAVIRAAAHPVLTNCRRAGRGLQRGKLSPCVLLSLLCSLMLY